MEGQFTEEPSFWWDGDSKVIVVGVMECGYGSHVPSGGGRRCSSLVRGELSHCQERKSLGQVSEVRFSD